MIPTGGLGEPFRWPGELVGPDVEGLAFGVALGGVGVALGGVGLGASDGSAGTGEMAERIAGCCVADEAAADSAANEEAGAWAAADVAVLAGPDPAATELAVAELPGA